MRFFPKAAVQRDKLNFIELLASTSSSREKIDEMSMMLMRNEAKLIKNCGCFILYRRDILL